MLYKQVSAYIDQYFIIANAFIRSKKRIFIKEQRENFFMNVLFYFQKYHAIQQLMALLAS